eukprot:272533-Chlamydomonas_euryale.AAC.3
MPLRGLWSSRTTHMPVVEQDHPQAQSAANDAGRCQRKGPHKQIVCSRLWYPFSRHRRFGRLEYLNAASIEFDLVEVARCDATPPCRPVLHCTASHPVATCLTATAAILNSHAACNEAERL